MRPLEWAVHGARECEAPVTTFKKLTIEVPDDTVEGIRLLIDDIVVPHVRVLSLHASPQRYVPHMIVVVQDLVYAKASIDMLKPFPWIDVVLVK